MVGAEPPRRRGGTARGERTRAALLGATAEVVARVGYSRATTRAIADAAGVSEGTIYRHFPDKRQLFLAAVRDRNAPAVEWMGGLPARAGTATLRENVVEALRRLAGMRTDLLPLELALRTDPELAQGIDLAAALADPDQPPQLIAAYLAAEQRLGRVRGDLDCAAAAVVLLATLFGLATSPDGAPDLDARIGAAVDVLVGGLAAAPGTGAVTGPSPPGRPNGL